ncbi:MAG: FAD:protein FMN transferase [Bacillota bacterium]
MVLPVTLLAMALLPGCSRKPFTESDFIMDTLVRIEVHGPRAETAARAALDEMRRVESLMSAYVETSDVSRINSQAGVAPVTISPETSFVLQEALRISEASWGAFDVTVGPLVGLWDIAGENPRVPSPEEIEDALEKVNYQRLQVKEGRAFLEAPGMRVDLGAIAKGYAVDRAAQILLDHGVTSAILDAGGNVYVVGSRSDGSPWRVGIRHPRREGEALAVLEASDTGVVTSGDYQRYFESDGVRYHHIFDPRTGYPARESASATVVSPSSVEADALSTALFVLGPVEGMNLIESLEGVEGLVVDAAGEITVSTGLFLTRVNP